MWACSRLRRRIGGSDHLPDDSILSIHLFTLRIDVRGRFAGTGEGGGGERRHIVIEGDEEGIYVGTKELPQDKRWL